MQIDTISLDKERNIFSIVTALLLAALILLPFTNIRTAQAQSIDQLSRSYINPFPQGGRYKVYVVGSSLAAGLAGGMTKAFEKDRTLEVKSHIRYNAGLINQRRLNWDKELRSLAEKDRMDIVVILLGLKEASSIWVGRKSYKFGTDEWRDTLGKRIDLMLKGLKKNKVSVYWVGLPVMRSPKLNENMQILNDVFRKHSFINGVKFVDTWNGFTDQFGRYSAFGPDINGNVRRLRENDGIKFSLRGNRKLAHFVEREISRDIAIAKSERNIPLAGTREEQSRIRKEIANKPKIKKRYSEDKTASKANKNDEDEDESFFEKLQRNLIGGGKKSSKEKKNSGTVIAGVKIVRPKLSDIVLSGSAARNSPGSISAITGDIIANRLESGVTALASVTSANDLSLKEVKRRVPLKQTPYYKVLVKGEMLKPKAGRADDFTWTQ